MPAAFGKHNSLHTHAFPLITAPSPARDMLGADGLRGMGASAELRLPTPFYSDLTFQAFDADWALFG